MNTDKPESNIENSAGKIPLKRLVSHIIDLVGTDSQDDGKIGNTRWRITGSKCGTGVDGCLELANAELFDRWANSSFLHFNVEMSMWEDNNVADTIERLFSIYG